MKKVFQFLFLTLVLMMLGTSVFARTHKAIIVFSYGEGQGCGPTIEKGMLSVMDELGYVEGKDITYERIYLESINKPQLVDKVAKKTIQKIKSSKPDVVIILDDVSFEKVALPLAKTDIKIIYGGVNVRPEVYDAKTDFMISRKKPGYNITGITEESSSLKGCQYISQIMPEAKGMAVLASKKQEFLRQIAVDSVEDMEKNPGKYPIELKETYYIDTFPDYKKKVLALNKRKDIDVVHYHSITSLWDAEKKNNINIKEIVRWTIENLEKPCYVWVSDWVGLGFLAGAGIDLELNGKQLAINTIKILKGVKPGEIPIEKPKDIYLSLNLARAQQLGVKVDYTHIISAKKLYKEMKVYPEYKYKK